MNHKLLRIGACLLCCAALMGSALASNGGNNRSAHGVSKQLERTSTEMESSFKVKKGPGNKDKKLDLGLDYDRYRNMPFDEGKAELLKDAKAALDAKVAEGILTAEKADEIYKHISEAPYPGILSGLGLNPSKYKDMKPEEAKTALLADAKAALDAKVAEGSLTQERADEILKKVEDMHHLHKENKKPKPNGDKASPEDGRKPVQ